MLAGVGFVSTLAASIAAYFVGQDKNTEIRRLEEQLTRIEQTLRKIPGEPRDGQSGQ